MRMATWIISPVSPPRGEGAHRGQAAEAEPSQDEGPEEGDEATRRVDHVRLSATGGESAVPKTRDGK